MNCEFQMATSFKKTSRLLQEQKIVRVEKSKVKSKEEENIPCLSDSLCVKANNNIKKGYGTWTTKRRQSSSVGFHRQQGGSMKKKLKSK